MPDENAYSFRNGPFLLCAVLCERVLQEQDGVKTAVRMIDRVTHSVRGPEVPSEMAPFQYNVFLLVKFKAGTARESMPVQIVLERPDGSSSPLPSANLQFEGPDDRGVDVVLPMILEISMTGLHWFDIVLKGIRVTRVPLRVFYNPISLPSQGSSPQPPASL